MKVEQYLDISQSPRIIVRGLEGKTQIVERPKLKSLRAVCRGKTGKILFKDSCTFEVTKAITVERAELWYGDIKVCENLFPDISMLMGDTLTVCFSLVIACKNRLGKPVYTILC